MAAAKAGDKRAFVELCDRCSPMIYRAIYRIVKSPPDAEDALQDCFFRAYRALNSFDERATFSSWITRIGINSALTVLRRRRRNPEVSIYIGGGDTDTWIMFDPADKTMGPYEFYIHNERATSLHKAISRLPAHLRSVIELQQTGGSARDVSLALNISVAAVKSRLVRARAELRRLLKTQFAER